MKHDKLALFISAAIVLVFAVLGWGAQWTWDGGGANNNWTTVENWTADLAYPTAVTDTVTINTGADTCVLDVNDTIAKWIITSGFSGRVDLTGRLLAFAGGGFINDGTGTHHYGKELQFLSNDSMHVGSGTGFINDTTTIIRCLGTGTKTVIDIDKTQHFRMLYKDNGKSVMSIGAAAHGYNLKGDTAVTMVFGGGGTVTINTSYAHPYVKTNGAKFIDYIDADAITFNGNDGFRFSSRFETPACIANMPAYTYSGTGSTYFVAERGSKSEIKLTGNFTVGTKNLYIYSTSNAVADSSVFDANDQNVTCGNLFPGNYGADSLFTMKWGNGTWNIAVYQSTSYNRKTYDSLEGAIINWSGATWANGNKHQSFPGASNFNIVGTAAQALTNAIWKYNNVTVNNTGTNFITFINLLECNNLMLLNGPWKQVDSIKCNSLKIQSTDSVIFNNVVIVRDSVVYAVGSKIKSLLGVMYYKHTWIYFNN